MQLPEAWRNAIEQWAAQNRSVREVWLFGSRAKGTARPDSDVDLAIKLMPASKGTDWALWRYSQFGDKWQNELIAILGRHVSLELFPPSDPGDRTARLALDAIRRGTEVTRPESRAHPKCGEGRVPRRNDTKPARPRRPCLPIGGP